MQFCTAISIDDNDIVYVTDLYNGRVLVFKVYFSHHLETGAKDLDNWMTHVEYWWISRMVLFTVYVSDFSNDRILKFSAKN